MAYSNLDSNAIALAKQFLGAAARPAQQQSAPVRGLNVENMTAFARTPAGRAMINHTKPAQHRKG